MENINIIETKNQNGLIKKLVSNIDEQEKLIRRFSIENDLLTIEFKNGNKFLSPIQDLKVKLLDQEDLNYQLTNYNNEVLNLEPMHLACFEKNDMQKIIEALNQCPNFEAPKETKYGWLIGIGIYIIVALICYFAFDIILLPFKF